MSDDRTETPMEPDVPTEDDRGLAGEQPEHSDAEVMESQEEEGPSDE
jgi:hypothetical protein